MNIPRLPFREKPRKKKKKLAHEFRNVPSIYIPTEMKTQDLSSMYIDSNNLQSRQERKEQERLKEEVFI